ncbi:unnamed protein product [Musa banksii]
MTGSPPPPKAEANMQIVPELESLNRSVCRAHSSRRTASLVLPCFSGATPPVDDEPRLVGEAARSDRHNRSSGHPFVENPSRTMKEMILTAAAITRPSANLGPKRSGGYGAGSRFVPWPASPCIGCYACSPSRSLRSTTCLSRWTGCVSRLSSARRRPGTAL